MVTFHSRFVKALVTVDGYSQHREWLVVWARKDVDYVGWEVGNLEAFMEGWKARESNGLMGLGNDVGVNRPFKVDGIGSNSYVAKQLC